MKEHPPTTPTACNAECASCGAGLLVRNDGRYPATRVPGNPTRLVFCTNECKVAWHNNHCRYCGATPRTTILTVIVNTDQYCSAEHYRLMDQPSFRLVP